MYGLVTAHHRYCHNPTPLILRKACDYISLFWELATLHLSYVFTAAYDLLKTTVTFSQTGLRTTSNCVSRMKGVRKVKTRSGPDIPRNMRSWYDVVNLKYAWNLKLTSAPQFNLKKRLGKEKKKLQHKDEGDLSQRLSSPSPPPSITNSVTSTVPDGRRASEPFTHTVSRPTQIERLASEPVSLGPSSTFALSERTRSGSAGRRNDPLGLTIIHEPETPPPCDIIFVHGLGGSSQATWAKGRDLSYFWPQRWLPFEPGIGDARILSFGYNANFAAPGPAPITGIADFARDLLYSMKYAKDENLKELELGQVRLFSR